MEIEFKYATFRRIVPFCVGPFLAPFIYSFLRAATQFDDIISSVLCVLAAGSFIFLIFLLWYRMRVAVILTDKGILIRRIHKKTSIAWEEISEYGRYRKFVYGGAAWCYYIKAKSNGEKKIVIGLEYFKKMHVLNNTIIRKAKNAKLINTDRLQGWKEP